MGGGVAGWFKRQRSLSSSSTPLDHLAGVVSWKTLVQLRGHACKYLTGALPVYYVSIGLYICFFQLSVISVSLLGVAKAWFIRRTSAVLNSINLVQQKCDGRFIRTSHLCLI